MGTFYRYFRDKDDVLRSLLREHLDEILSFARSPWQASDPLRSIGLTTARYFEFYENSADLFALLIEASSVDAEVEALWAEARSRFFFRIERMLDRGRVAGLIRPSTDTAVAAALLGGMTEYYAYLWFVLGRAPERGIHEVSREVTAIWAEGVFLPNSSSHVSDGMRD